MAAARVFAVAELTEMILLRLPTKELLISKRVCRAFRDAQENSTKIKKALFLLPGIANDTSDDASYPVPRFSASVSALKKYWNHYGYEVPLPETASGGVSFNPLLVERFVGTRLGVPLSPLHPGPAMDLRHSPARFKVSLLYAGAEASCRRMFVTQPPLPVVTTQIKLQFRERGIYQSQESFGMLLSDIMNTLQGMDWSKANLTLWEFGLRSEQK